MAVVVVEKKTCPNHDLRKLHSRSGLSLF